MWLMYQELGIKAEFAYMVFVTESGPSFHVSVVYDGFLYEATGGFVVPVAYYEKNIIELFSYDFTMAVAVIYDV